MRRESSLQYVHEARLPRKRINYYFYVRVTMYVSMKNVVLDIIHGW